jgi:hypothetical protein
LTPDAPDQIVSVNPNGLRFRGTPTVLLIDAAGTVQRTWFGKLQTPAEESELLSLIAK